MFSGPNFTFVKTWLIQLVIRITVLGLLTYLCSDIDKADNHGYCTDDFAYSTYRFPVHWFSIEVRK